MEQRAFYQALVSAYPELASCFSAAVDTDGQHTILAIIPSPTGDKSRDVEIWVDYSDLSVGFYLPWHVHCDLSYSPDSTYDVTISLIDMVKMILNGELLMVRDAASDNELAWDVFIPSYGNDVLVDALTDPLGSGAVEIRSWSGTKDRRMTLADLNDADSDRAMTTRIEMVEVAARDGLQNEPGLFPTADKLELIARAGRLAAWGEAVGRVRTRR